MGWKSRSVAAIALVASLLAANIALAASVEWGTYHMNEQRLGVNVTENQDARSGISMIWTFPRTDVVPIADEETVVDMNPADPATSELIPAIGVWRGPADLVGPPGDYYGDNTPTQLGYYWAQSISEDQAAANPRLLARARWYFPVGLATGAYQVFVWTPSSGGGRTNTTAARYTVVDCDATTGVVISRSTHEVDQRDGGNWIPLRSEPFLLSEKDYIELSNVTDDGGADEIIVCADAVRFLPSTGMEIYSSPAAGHARVGEEEWSGNDVPVVWVGAVESGIASAAIGVKDFGAVYCIRSYFQESAAVIDWNGTEEKGVGTVAWRYPRGGAYDGLSPDVRLPIEGPIGRIGAVGGVFSSPTLVTMPDGSIAVVVGGMDGQVYCLDATTGELIWKGPGVTISEDPGSTSGEWSVVSGRYDAFGGSFAYIPAESTGGTTGAMVYDISSTDSDPGSDAGKQDGPGHMYAVYAWMPGKLAGDPERTKDAAYGITYYDPVAKEQRTDWVRVDQSSDSDLDDPNIGKWARVGGKYWNPSRIVLSMESQMPDSLRVGRVVVADAVMVVPEDIGPFSYSSAVFGDGRAFIGNTNGRVYAFPLRGVHQIRGGNYAAQLQWTYPKVQTKNPASKVDDAAATPFGSIVSSPAYQGGLLVVSSLDGKVYAIKNLNLSETDVDLKWTYTAAQDDPSDPLSFETEGFSSSPAIYGSRVYVPSSGGRMHAMDLVTGDRKWVYPDRATGEAPLSAFRYSTPAVATEGGRTKIYCGSTGGRVYRFVDNGPTGGLDVSFAHPSFWVPVQSSVAVDTSNIFVGTMGTGDGEDGGFWWVSRNLGTPSYDGFNVWSWSGYTDLGQVFSSPASANDYVYVGTGKGRLCAFSSTAFGGMWVGGPEGSEPPGRKSDAPVLTAETPQADIFTATTFDATRLGLEGLADPANPQLDDGPLGDLLGRLASLPAPVDQTDFFTGSDINDDHLAGHRRAMGAVGPDGTRQVFLEWGEDIYLIAWNLPQLDLIAGAGETSLYVGGPAKRNSVKFRFANASPGAGSGGTIDPKSADFLFQYQMRPDPATGEERLRCVALAKVEIRADRSNPPSPGAAWTISVTVNTQVTADGKTTRAVSAPGVVPRLVGGPRNWSLRDATKWEEQPVGINNPLAIRDDGLYPTIGGPMQGTPTGLAWPTAVHPDGSYATNRNDPLAHFNGNGTYGESGQWVEVMPKLYLGWAAHGTNSRVAKLGVMDRSAVGLRGTPIYDAEQKLIGINRTDWLKTFRMEPSDLHWLGGNDAVARSGGTILPWDYPPFYSFGTYQSRLQRDYPDISRTDQRFQKTSDNADPTIERSQLLPALPRNLDDPYDRDYDNARLRPDFVDSWVQVPQFQPANLMRPGYGTTVTAFLDTNGNGRFDSGQTIARRPTTYMEVYRQFVMSADVPPDYHTVVERPLTIDITGPDRALAPHGLGIGVDRLNLGEWYKQFSVRNLGNVNLVNMNVAKVTSAGRINLYADNVNPAFPLTTDTSLGTGIVSSFDGWDPQWPNANLAMEPFLTQGFGFTLSKSRVGDVIPMELTIPDARKCQEWPLTTAPAIQMADLNWFATKGNVGLPPSVSVRVPLTQPSGSYHALVPVFSDANNNGRLDFGAEAYTEPTFRLNVAVAEDRLTGGATPGSAVQIDASIPPDPNVSKLVFGDTQPTAWRDSVTGNVYLFWSSNRFIDPSSSPSPNDPWFIAHAELLYDRTRDAPDAPGPGQYNWRIDDSNPTAAAWWAVPAPSAGNYQLPGSSFWPDITPEMIPGSVRHSAPFVATYDNKKVWLFWHGQVAKRDPTTNQVTRENRILYTPATDGVITQPGSIYNFARDLSLAKVNPKAIFRPGPGASQEHMWLLWQGGDAGRWSIFGNLNLSAQDNHDPTAWSPDVRFLTPTSLAAVADPNPIYCAVVTNPAALYIDVAYTGMSKYNQVSDVLFTRYTWNPNVENPNVQPAPLPRVRSNALLTPPADPANDPEKPWRNAEELQRDPKLNVYTSEHLAWIRPPRDGMVDEWEMRDYTPAQYTDAPFIRVRFADGTVVSGTDGRVIGPQGQAVQAPVAIAPQVDRATGVYTYTHTGDAAKLIGQMLVDFSAGIVRFTQPLPPKTKVYAQYTPQAKRLTRGPEQDSAPFVFKQRDQRLWLFWRKPTTSGVQASTIYYKTYRITAHLERPVELAASTGQPTNPVTSPELGNMPIEVSWDGKKLHFPDAAERYPALKGYPGPVTVRYTPVNNNGNEIAVTFDTLTWEEELAETALPTRQNVNEGQVWAFTEDQLPLDSSRAWVFWSSTRAGESDLYYQTISPNFRAR